MLANARKDHSSPLHVFSSWKFRVCMRGRRVAQSEIIEVFNQKTTTEKN